MLVWNKTIWRTSWSMLGCHYICFRCEPVMSLSYETFYNSGSAIMIYKELSASQQKPIKISLKQCRREGRLDWSMESYWKRAQQGVCARPRLPSDIIISAMTERTAFVSFSLIFVASRPCKLFAFLNTHSERCIVCLLCKYVWELECRCACVCLNSVLGFMCEQSTEKNDKVMPVQLFFLFVTWSKVKGH